MKRVSIKIPVLSALMLFSLLSFFCMKNKPTSPDGTVSAKFAVVDTSGTLAGKSFSDLIGVPGARVRITSIDYAEPMQFETDENGYFEVINIRSARYRISADKFIPADTMWNLNQQALDVQLSGSIEIDLSSNENDHSRFVIEMNATFLSSIVINEIYYSGPANSGLYYSDQFVELFNASDSVEYLDGLILCRASTRLDYMGQFAEVFYTYQFPGNGTDFPIQPGQFVVVAQDAMDHISVGGAPGSVDLSHADWECYNQLGNDLDNPNVPNLININPNKAIDFMISLSHNGVILAKVDDNSQLVFNEKGYVLFNFSDVLDGVEYASNSDANKEMEPRIDSGFAGNGILRYSGHSTERENPETGAPGYDTNNSTFDFVSLQSPTPGYQHRSADLLTPLK